MVLSIILHVQGLTDFSLSIFKCLRSFVAFISISFFLISALILSGQVYAESASKLTIEAIECSGNKNTKCGFITKKYYQGVGDILDPDKIADARLRLGSLLQFKSIAVQLEKGSEKGRVIVVFAVQEMSHLQYGLGVSVLVYDKDRHYIDLEESESGQIRKVSLSITDLNLFGTGKALSFNLAGLSTKYRTVRNNSRGNYYNYSRYSDEVDYDHGYRGSLEYIDPHLFGSQDYFFNAYFSHRSYYLGRSNLILSHDEANEIRKGSDSNLNQSRFGLGRRIGKVSYIQLSVDPEDDFNDISYGWNTENDAVFPTEGSVFKISTSFDLKDSFLYYRENYDINSGDVITFTGRLLKVEGDKWEPDILDRSLSVRYTLLNSKNRSTGKYRGAYAQLTRSRKTYDWEVLNSDDLSFEVGYSLQTDSTIFSFSFRFLESDGDEP